jgi:hypothetical protein
VPGPSAFTVTVDGTSRLGGGTGAIVTVTALDASAL